MHIQTKAAIALGNGAPLIVDDIQVRAPGPNEVLVEMKASGLCHTDLSAMEGKFPVKLPAVLGHEGAGVVVECGPGVTSVKPGDPVILNNTAHCGTCPPCLSKKNGLLRYHGAGRSVTFTLHLARGNTWPDGAISELFSTYNNRSCAANAH